MFILFGLLLARRFYCRSALSLSPGRTGGLFPRINAPMNKKPPFIGKLFSYPYGSSNFDAESVFCAKDGDPILP